MIRFTSAGSTKRTERFLDKMMRLDLDGPLDKYGQRGVDALRSATPELTGLTAESWDYEIVSEGGKTTIWWTNTNKINGFHVAIGLQYGHATGTGGWVRGYDYINPSLRPIFDELADAVWKEVQSA